jgi:2-oxoglutarate dehydrogenase E1 component
MQVTNCTTPANFFHLLRRQLKRPFRKPLIVFTPKSLLRHPRCVSTLEDLSTGHFQEVIDDNSADPALINKLVFCSGKIYYDLLEEKLRSENQNTALIRVEQLHPFPHKQLKQILAKYNQAIYNLWVQEEPMNMGPWHYIHHEFKDVPLKVISRPASGSPATGLSKFHALRQKKIVDKTFGICDCIYLEKECGMMCIGNRWRSFEKELNELKVEKIDSSFHTGEKQLQ